MVIALLLGAVARPGILTVGEQVSLMIPNQREVIGDRTLRAVRSRLERSKDLFGAEQAVYLADRGATADSIAALSQRHPGNGLLLYLALLPQLGPATSAPADHDDAMRRQLAGLLAGPPAHLHAGERWRILLDHLKSQVGSIRAATRQADLLSVGFTIARCRVLHRLTAALQQKADIWRSAGRPYDAALADLAVVRLYLDLVDDSPQPDLVIYASRYLPRALRSLAAASTQTGIPAETAARLPVLADSIEGLLRDWHARQPRDAINLLPGSTHPSGGPVRAAAEHDRVMGSLVASTVGMATWLLMGLVAILLLPFSLRAWRGGGLRWRWQGLGRIGAVAIVSGPMLMLVAVGLWGGYRYTWLVSFPTLPAAIWLPWTVPLAVALASRICIVPPEPAARAIVPTRAILLVLLSAGALILLLWAFPAQVAAGRPPAVLVLRRLATRLGMASLLVVAVWTIWSILRHRRQGRSLAPAAMASLGVAAWSWAWVGLVTLVVLNVNQHRDRHHAEAYVAASQDRVVDRLGHDWYDRYFQDTRMIIKSVAQHLSEGR